MQIKASVEILAVTSIRRGKGDYDIANAIVAGELMGERFGQRCQIVHMRGQLEIGKLNEIVTASISLRQAREDYPAQLSIFLISRLKKTKAA